MQSSFDNSILTAMGTLLTVTVFLLGFAATRWRSDRDLRIKAATEEHKRLLERAAKPLPMPGLDLRRRMLHLWQDTIMTWIMKKERRPPERAELPDALHYYHWDYSQKVALGGLLASVALYLVGAIDAGWRPTWPPEPSWWAIMVFLAGGIVVIVTSMRERYRHFLEIDQEFSRLPLVQLYNQELHVPKIVRSRQVEEATLELLRVATERNAIESLRLPGDEAYWGKYLQGMLKTVADYPDIPWGRSLHGRYQLWKYLHEYGPHGGKDTAEYLLKARSELEEAVRYEGDPIANIALVRVLELQDYGTRARRQELIDRAIAQITSSPLGTFGVQSWIMEWFIPKTPGLREQLKSIDAILDRKDMKANPDYSFE